MSKRGKSSGNGKRKIVIAVVIVLMVAAVGCIAYGFYDSIQKGERIETADMARISLVLASLIISLTKLCRGSKGARRTPEVYRKEYGFIFDERCFADDKKREKAFCAALDDYNDDRYAAALKQLEKLKSSTIQWQERCAIDFFIALCYQDMGSLKRAVESYEAVLAVRDCATAASNMGLCYQQLGDSKSAERAYLSAIRADPKEPFALNNLAQLLVRDGKYAEAAEYAERAVAEKDNFRQAYTALAVCYAMLNDIDAHERNLAKAVANGADRRAILDYVENLK